ncbi:MAG: ATPase [Dictyoglomus sp.]|nr:ATPase [Dictyoglomus sp.]MCX7941907.1 ATPase [Dictyoglomaceae bacterium]MDW8188598.1 ATPase [Dictyoglomus sp.]
MLNRSFEIIEEIRSIIKKGLIIPVLEKVVIDYNKLVSLIEDLDRTLPEELAEAKRIIRRKEEILKEAEEEAQSVIKIAKEKAENLLRESNITLKAQKEAETIIEEAKKEANEIKKEAEDYILVLLNKVEEVLKRELEIINKCKNELKM